MTMVNRRTLLRNSALTGALGLVSTTGRAVTARPTYAGPNVVIVRFGGGVRRRETIDAQHTYSPYLLKSLSRRGTLFTNMEVSNLEGITQTSHAQGTLYLLTGRYDAYEDVESQFLGERFEPAAPTLFEYLRKSYDVADYQCLIVNGERSEERRILHVQQSRSLRCRLSLPHLEPRSLQALPVRAADSRRRLGRKATRENAKTVSRPREPRLSKRRTLGPACAFGSILGSVA